MKKTMLLVLNSFRSLKQQLIQIFVLSNFIVLLSLIISLTQITNFRIINSYNDLINNSNQHQFILDINRSHKIKKPAEDLENNQELFQQYILNELSLKYDFSYSRTESRTINSVFHNNQQLKIKTTAKTHQNNNHVDDIVISQGKNFSQEQNKRYREIIISEQFAKQNNIKINDIIRITPDVYGDSLLVFENEQVANDLKDMKDINNEINGLDKTKYKSQLWFQVVGFGQSADLVSPIIDNTTVIPNFKTDLIAYIDPVHFGLLPYQDTNMYIFNQQKANIIPTSDIDIEHYYSFVFNTKSNYSKSILKDIEFDYKKMAGITYLDQYFYDINDNTYKFSDRVLLFEQVIIAYNVILSILVLCISVISGFILIIITKKIIEHSKKQIGFLKAIGYKNSLIVTMFLIFPVIVTLIGGIIGYICSIFISSLVVNVFSSFFNISFFTFKMEFFSILLTLIFIYLILALIATIYSFFYIKKPVLNLLSDIQFETSSYLTMSIKSISKNKKIDTRLRTALISSSISKIVGLSFAMLVSTLLITTTVSIPRISKDNVRYSLNNQNYKNLIKYTQPISNNPLSFYKTYNPDFQSDKWGWNLEKTFMDSYNNLGSTTEVWTAYPIKDLNVGLKKRELDVNEIINSLYNSDISSEYWTFNAAKKETAFWANMAFWGWKNSSIEFLNLLDNVQMPSGSIGNTALGALLDQWPDYQELKTSISKLNVTNTPSKEDLQNYFDIFQWFYKKYISGTPLTWNKVIGLDTETINNRFYLKNIESISLISMDSFLENYNNIYYYDLSQNTNLLPFEIINPSINADIIARKENDEIYNFLSIDSKDLSYEELKLLNTYLTYWYGSIFSNRLSQALLQTTYSRSPYFVQENIKKAINEQSTYNITFNVVPFNNTYEELGTMLISEFINKNNKKETLEIYGIHQNNTTFNLFDKKSNNLKSVLFKTNTQENEIPIIINQTTAIKLNKFIDDNFDANTLQKLLNVEDSNGQYYAPSLTSGEVKIGTSVYNKKFKTQSDTPYYSTNAKQFSGGIAGAPVPFKPGSIGGYNIAGNMSINSTNPSPINIAANNGQAIIQDSWENKTFKIAGVQNSYGQPQAWIKNDDANKILGYDQIKAYNFMNFFIKQWALVPELYDLNNAIFKDHPEQKDEIQKLLSSKSSDKSLYYNFDLYYEFLNQVNLHGQDSAWYKMNQFFENQYPVFNYKNSKYSEIIDLSINVATTQQFGDYSAVGLNGGLKNNQWHEGFGKGSINTLVNNEEMEKMLNQLNNIALLISFIFISFALIIAISVILLTIYLIIKENNKFIATMKTLGYSNKYIIYQLLNFYIISMFIMYILANIISWFMLKYIFIITLSNEPFIFPVVFNWIIPITSFGLLLVLVITAILICYNNVNKIKVSQITLLDN